jgi:O-antigen/teichoic acid export membrane protein
MVETWRMNVGRRMHDPTAGPTAASVIRRLGWVFLHQGVGRAAVFGFFAMLPLRLPLEAVGHFTLAYATLLLILQPVFDTAVNTMLVRAAARGEAALVQKLARRALQALAAVLIAGFLIADLIGLPAVWSWLLGSLALSLPLGMVFAISRGSGRFDVEGVVGSLQKLSLLPLLVWLAAAAIPETAPAQALLLSALVGWFLLASVYGRRWFASSRRAPALELAAPGRESLSEILRLTALAAVSLVYLRIDLALLGWFTDFADVGLYATAARWVEALAVVPYGVMLALFPRLSLRRPSPAELGQALRLFGWLGLLLCAAGLLLGQFVIPRLYAGATGGALGPLLVLLSPWPLAVSLGMFCSQTLVASGRSSLALAASLAGLVTHLMLALPAIPVLGVRGAAMAAVGTEIAVACVSGLLLRRSLRDAAAP